MTEGSIKNRREFLEKTFKTGLWTAVVTSGLIGPLVKVMANVPAKLPPGQSIYDFSGEVTVDKHAITSKNMEKTIVRADSTIVTASSSWIIFAVGKDAHNLRENSTLVLQGSGMLETGMRLFTGAILSVFGSRDEKEQYKLHTSTATVGIRGTGLYAESQIKNNRSYICTCYGDVNISSIADPSINEDVKTNHHDNPKYVYADDSNGDIIQPAPFINHTDVELQLIETIVGRNTPFSSVKEAYPRPRRGY
ncbi:hypothetical protein CXF85_02425 [Colwellia sp. 75C3]|uniref:hypothetical protein n=1 Tax=Colwellia sp. 75C3 TaxID=888425 RepID=UPI000C31D512|nr:hypothetical protein [Colwellia sp. 75C3]PKG85669.1 hypothetical protein CXF85_02425 [Colwellia sp. 75C3]